MGKASLLIDRDEAMLGDVARSVTELLSRANKGNMRDAVYLKFISTLKVIRENAIQASNVIGYYNVRVG
jgi:hypothetical protein